MLRDEFDNRNSACPDTSTLEGFAAERLTGERKAEVEHHVMFCPQCRRAIFRMGGSALH